MSVPNDTLADVTIDNRTLSWHLAYQHGVLSREQVSACGMTHSNIRYRIRSGGPWQRLLPGIYLTVTGRPTWEQQQTAALLFAGPGSVITGPAALWNYRIKVATPRAVDVLIPIDRQKTSPGFVVVHRTRRMPETVICDGPVRFAPPERAVADAVRGMTSRQDARAIVAGAVQQGQCTIEQLVAELAAGPVRGSAPLREVLAEVIDGIRSPAEGDFRALVTRSGLPQPLYNPSLYLGGVFLAKPDAWWPNHGVAVEIDSREWHLSPREWEQTMARHARMSAAGILVLHFSPSQQRDDPDDVITKIAQALHAGRPLPAITTRPLAA